MTQVGHRDGRRKKIKTRKMAATTHDEVGAPTRLSVVGLLQPLTFQFSILYLWQYSQVLI